MKPKSSSPINFPFTDQFSNAVPILFLFAVLAAATLTGCATAGHEAPGSVVRAGPTLSDRTRAGLGVIGIVTPAAPALVVIGKSNGQIDYPSDRAGLIARDILS